MTNLDASPAIIFRKNWFAFRSQSVLNSSKLKNMKRTLNQLGPLSAVRESCGWLFLLTLLALGGWHAAAATLYVWQESPNPAPPFTNWDSAARTIQDAVDAAVAGDTVLVTNGIYATGGRAFAGENRVAIDRAIRVQSINGPALTVIRGAPATGSVIGIGDGAIRGAYLGDNAILSGFTLTNGYTRNGTPGQFDPDSCGGGVCSAASGIVTNCLLTGNVAFHGGGAYGGNIHQCTLLGNRSDNYLGTVGGGGGAAAATLRHCTLSRNYARGSGGGAYKGVLYQCNIQGNSAAYCGGGVSSAAVHGCVLQGNSGGSGGGAQLGSLHNCVLAGNSAFYDGGGAAGISGNPVMLYNCVVVGNTNNFAHDSGLGGGVYAAKLQNSIVWNNGPFSNVDPYSSVTDHSFVGGNPKFVDAASGDYRLRWDSPCIDAGTNLTGLITNDIAGNPRPLDGNGDGLAAFDIGAFEFVPVSPAITNQPVTQTLSPGGVALFTVAADGNPPPTYQWYFGSNRLTGANGATLTISNAGPAEVGSYWVAITNFAGGVASTPAHLWLNTLQMYAGLNVYGPPGGTCAVQYTTNLEPNRTNLLWTTLTNITIQKQPEVIIDFTSPGQPKRFYRTVPEGM